MEKVEITFTVTKESTRLRAVGGKGNILEMDITDTSMEHNFKNLLNEISKASDCPRFENWN